eukprot:2695742-Pleurochrysis_carterae.AAC.2
MLTYPYVHALARTHAHVHSGISRDPDVRAQNSKYKHAQAHAHACPRKETKCALVPHGCARPISRYLHAPVHIDEHHAHVPVDVRQQRERVPRARIVNKLHAKAPPDTGRHHDELCDL